MNSLHLQFSEQPGLGLKSLPFSVFLAVDSLLAAGGGGLKCACLNAVIKFRITYF